MFARSAWQLDYGSLYPGSDASIVISIVIFFNPYSVIVIMIKKMLAMKSKTSTLKISEQTYPANNLNNQAQSTIYTAKI